jgi:integrase/recombinase XerD
VFSDAERVALAGFLAGYRGQTREAYALDLRQFTTWCWDRSLPPFAVRRADIELSPATWKTAAGPGLMSLLVTTCSLHRYDRLSAVEVLEDSAAATPPRSKRRLQLRMRR